ncbi:NRDE family protein [Modicisalibacter xianhensis]|uniref:Uncharacterized conserved protein, contains NRDE domain n=1 Tax=Modicisalibacter xianhensis TaxID=442341 RepID=A0A1I2YCI9_9GAMM|nr:NRDE family protein [Halomonas xianhensis]SFH22696.1 Uncharacterized conserved protein, contains NRDE domain [Halomonas xianhensis]
MCLIVLDWQPGSLRPLRLAANRDEFYDRPTAPLARWQEAPDVLGGRDLRAGGTWLAVHRKGRMAAVTNVRDPQHKAPADGPSRGELVRNALECDSLTTWLEDLARRGASSYAGFNLLASDGHTLWHLHHGRTGTRLQQVAPGLHGLSNATLDTPWPKLLRSRRALEDIAALPTSAFAKQAWSLLADEWRPDDTALPNTGVGLELERLLSAPFITSRDYGTRASTWLSWHAEGQLDMGERSFGPHGQPLDEREQSLALSPLLT